MDFDWLSKKGGHTINGIGRTYYTFLFVWLFILFFLRDLQVRPTVRSDQTDCPIRSDRLSDQVRPTVRSGQTDCPIRSDRLSDQDVWRLVFFVLALVNCFFLLFNFALCDDCGHSSRSVVKTLYLSRNASARLPHKPTYRSEGVTDLDVWRLPLSALKSASRR